MLEQAATCRIWLLPIFVGWYALCNNSVYLGFSSIIDETAYWLHVSSSAIISLAAVGNLGAFAGAVCAVFMIDQHGIRCTFFATGILTLVGCSLRVLSATESFWTFTFGQFVVNIGSGLLNSLPAPLSARYFPKENQAMATSIGIFGVSLGGLIGPLVGCAFRGDPGSLVSAQFLAAWSIGPCLLLWPDCSHRRVLGSIPATDQKTTWSRTRQLLLLDGMMLFLLGAVICTSIFLIVPSSLEALACAVPGLDAATLAGIMVIGSLFGTLLSGWMTDSTSLGLQHLLFCCIAISSAGWIFCGVGWWTRSLVLTIIGWSALACFGCGMLLVAVIEAIARAAYTVEGTACAYLYLGQYVLAAALQLLVAAPLLGNDLADCPKDSALYFIVACIALFHIGVLLMICSPIMLEAQRTGTELLLR